MEDTVVVRELILIVRPEERSAVERTLQALRDTAFVSLSALGRGGGGSLQYRKGRKWFGRESSRATFLPKAVFYLSVPADEVDEVLAAVRGALRASCGPSDLGLGLGLVMQLDDETSIEDAP